MKGIIFNLVEEVVATELGDDDWDSLLDSAGLSGVYTSLGSYPDEELFSLVGAASTRFGMARDDVIRHLGEGALPPLAERYPSFFKAFDSSRPFLVTLNNVHQNEVRKLYPGAEVPDFEITEGVDGSLVIGYRSKRMLCSLAEGLIVGTARYYGESVELTHLECMKTGSQRCKISCHFTG